ncbi:lysin [Paenarthrobacter nicotinovorans]|uniref:peptidoglycan recognition protein family protein n=1 Tax=Paenarthrobacter nicotinovorans TaxID=29320 RepID=UPI0007CBCC65|nr:peptidoglycan recognition family protein [Paenarthrobacter nicotinovorans]GAT87959.1 lysin [Paenarthrobacter nicotinovorans]
MYELTTAFTSPFRAARTLKVQSITIHWWDKPERNPSFQGTVDWLCREGTTASAHYVVEAGRVACIVSPDEVAWHAGDGGNGPGNMTSIGIECNPRGSDGDYATVAELVRELRAAYGDLPLFPHRHWTTTECPGTYDLDRINQLAAAADPQEDEMTKEERDMLNATHSMTKEIYDGLYKGGKSTPDGKPLIDLWKEILRVSKETYTGIYFGGKSTPDGKSLIDFWKSIKAAVTGQ